MVKTNKAPVLTPDQHPLFYYNDRVTVCLVVDTSSLKVTARGVCICSPKDQFVKRVGRAKAQGRAVQALVHKWSNYQIVFTHNPKTPFQELTKWAGTKLRFTSIWLPGLTEHEERIVNAFLTRKAKAPVTRCNNWTG